MNCKPGVMAEVIRPHFRHGVIVEVVRECTQAERADLVTLEKEWSECGHVWLCGLATGSRGIDTATGKAAYLLPGDEAFIADKYLRPIRDPGDDTQDETLYWLPVPSTEKEGA